MMYFVFVLTLIAILLLQNQSASFVSSVLTLVKSAGRLESESSPVVSSANKTVKRSVALGRSLMKHKNRMGPSEVPWNTDSASRSCESERQPLISTFCVLFDK